MIFSSHESLEDSIIRYISRGLNTTQAIYEKTIAEGGDVSIQAVYKAMRKLIKDSIVVKQGQRLEISQEWLNKFSTAFDSLSPILELADGESATFSYNSLINLDSYWKHLMKSLESTYPNYPIFLYSPYHIWYHISERMKSEAEYFSSFNQNMRNAFFVIGNNTEPDLQFKKMFQGKYLQIDAWEHSTMKETSYLTIIEDYVVYTILSKKQTESIRQFYLNPSSSRHNSAQLNQALIQKSKSKIKITRSMSKAKQLRKKLSKNFYISKEIKSKFDLF